MIKRIIIRMQLIRIVLHAIIMGIFFKLHLKKPLGKKVLVLNPHIFGDAVVFGASMKEFLEVFPKEQGYKVLFIASPSIIEFMKELPV